MAVAAAGAVACLVAVAPGCTRPVVGEPAKGAQAAAGPEVRITGATIDGTGHVIASLELTNGGVGVESVAAARALAPAFTLATMSTHPVDGLAAWKSLLLTGAQTIPALRPSGPPTPASAVLTDVRQPGSETSGTLAGANGAFTYTFATMLPAGFDPGQTLRVGVWLADDGTPAGTSTYDFRPAGGAPAPRDTVLDANCATCHGETLRSPRGAVGVKMCVTCHTWQNADPDTADPAALQPASPAADPNPLDFGRMVHRIHRGKALPTLYTASSSAPAPALPSSAAPPLPFLASRNAPIPGRKYSVVGSNGREVTFGRIVTRTDNYQTPGKTVATGVAYPRDLRDCRVCHGGAPQEYEVLYGIARRTCNGCHPDVWFAPPNGDGTTSITDTVHLAHLGGPQADDTQCRGCHVAATAAQPKVYAPIAQIHAPPHLSPRYAMPTVEIVSVENLRPGSSPTIRFRAFDRVGVLSPPNAPTPAADPSPSGSPVPRALERLTLTLGGATVPDFSGVPISSGTAPNPNPAALVADANGVFAYTFASKLPASAAGTWAVAVEARRRGAPPHYDPATDAFAWPYTGETVTESARNAVVYVDTATGQWASGAPGAAAPRRRVVSQQKCDRCHGRLALHGSQRNEVEYCLLCHTPDRTDWAQRPKVNGNVNLAATYDGIEERTIQLKVMIHRLHTGGRRGTAALDAIDPYVVYGYGGSAYFFDEGGFPNDLARCTVCHEGDTYRVESVPPGAPPNVANETATILHAGADAHPAGEPSVPAIQAACLGCHATAYAARQATQHTVDGVEQCAQCHARGALSTDVAHGLARLGTTAVASSFADIAEKILVPRCASAACHGGSPPAAFPRLDAEAAHDALVGVSSEQVAMSLVEPYEPAKSYLVLKMRNEAGAVGGIATPMPIGDALLDASDVAAIEAWIANGAPND